MSYVDLRVSTMRANEVRVQAGRDMERGYVTRRGPTFARLWDAIEVHFWDAAALARLSDEVTRAALSADDRYFLRGLVAQYTDDLRQGS